MKEFTLPEDFLLGSATSATQIEGGDYCNNWYYWAEECRTYKCQSPIIADNHYILYKEDMRLLKKLHHETYRFSIDWSRIEPQQGVWNEDAIAHYRHEISIMLENGIKPLLTLQHFSCPQWFQEEIGWHKDGCVEYFLKFVEKLVNSIGDLVSEYCTINEPNVLVFFSYIEGIFPPGIKNSSSDYFKAAKNLILAHLKSYKLVHKIRERLGFADTKVGFPLNIPYLEAKNPVTAVSKKILEFFFLEIFEVGFIDGKLLPPLGTGYPIGKGTYCDFIGVNYYTRFFVELSKNPATFFTKIATKKDLTPCEKSDVGWEIYPQGLYYVIKNIGKRFDLPIYITENGIADRTDTRRAKFIYSHLLEVSKLIERGYDVQSYYYWAFMDNYEWAEGYPPRYGLLDVYYPTQQRINRKSSRFYTELIKKKEVDQKLITHYLEGPDEC